jgi:hypothetical protein
LVGRLACMELGLFLLSDGGRSAFRACVQQTEMSHIRKVHRQIAGEQLCLNL